MVAIPVEAIRFGANRPREGCGIEPRGGSWRVVFRWSGGNAFDVQIVDYH